MTPQVISVSEFLAIINETLVFAYPQVTIEGEVSSFKVNQGKFIFFDLKDKYNLLSCFMMAHQLKLPIEDGMKVRVTGAPKVTKFSKFSLTVRDVQLAGEGQLRRAMELLKQKLQKEGLFDPARKRPIPKYPRRIGLITSGASAAYSDFIKILNARWGAVEVLLADVSVQGAQAPDQIVGALEYFNQLAEPTDVLVLIRGGGSLEDLMAFSTEPVARAVAASRTPIIVGVGHEIDFSLADYAADLRAATPTDAARLVVPDRAEITARVSYLSRHIESAMHAATDARRMQIDRSISQLEAYLRHPRERLQAHVSTLWRGIDRISGQVQSQTERVGNLQRHLMSAQTRLILDHHQQLAGLTRILRSFNPQAVLDRGYAIVHLEGHVLTDASQAKPGQAVSIQLAKGSLEAGVTNILPPQDQS